MLTCSSETTKKKAMQFVCAELVAEGVYHTDTLPETNSSPPENGWLKDDSSLLGGANCGVLLVLGRVRCEYQLGPLPWSVLCRLWGQNGPFKSDHFVEKPYVGACLNPGSQWVL